VCVYNLTIPGCNAYASYCHPRPAQLYDIFPHYFTNDTIFGNKLLNLKMCFDFLYNLAETFFIPTRTKRDTWGASSPLCWFNNKEFCVLHVQSNTTILYLVVQYESLFACCAMLPLETLLPGDPSGGVVYLRIVLSPEQASRLWMFLNVSVLQGGVVCTSPNPKAGGPPLVGCPRLLIQFIRSYPPYRRPFLYPQPEDAPCRGHRKWDVGMWTGSSWPRTETGGGRLWVL
jgi:hypothetical protein